MNVQNKGLKTHGAMRDQISLGGDADLPLEEFFEDALEPYETCLLYTSPSPRD